MPRDPIKNFEKKKANIQGIRGHRSRRHHGYSDEH